MLKNIFISISAAALLFGGLASNVNVSAQAPFVADENYGVAVSETCDFAVKFKKPASHTDLLFSNDSPSLSFTSSVYNEYYLSDYSPDGQQNGLPGMWLSKYENSIERFSLYCDTTSTWTNFIDTFKNIYLIDYNGPTTIDALTYFTQDSKNEITNIVTAHDGTSGDPVLYIFQRANGTIYVTPDYSTNHSLSDSYDTNFSMGELYVQFDSLSPSEATYHSCFFWDVNIDNIFINFICSLKNDGIIGGYPDGTYQPTRSVTRGEMAVFIKRAFNVATDTSCGDFSDMDSTTPFYEEATSLKCAGIIGGYPDGAYKPANNVTRGEMSVFIKKAANNAEEKIPSDTTCVNFGDMNSTTPFYEEATSLKCKGVIGGYPDGTYKQNNKVNRGELSVFIDRSRKL